MVEVSKEYMDAALSPGRSAECVILAGEYSFGDKEILSFEFNDVVHPEDMSFGTTCANRFHFEVWSRHSIPLMAPVRPYVAFKKDAAGNTTEFRMLGEFFISRRYRNKERYSITCYDKMFRLDARYRPGVEFPCKAAEILDDIALQYNFEVGFVPADDEIETIPKLATCREIVGYIAGMNGGFAKFDRLGTLRLRKLEMLNFLLERKNYMSLSLKADPLEVRSVEFVNDDESFTEGKGTKLTTYRQYNPLATEAAAKRVFSEWNGFTYHGMTVKMQGLPFLESGFCIYVQDDFGDNFFVAVISDYTLYYDGTLSATLVSKSKNPVDDYDEPMTEQRLMESLSQSLRIRYHNYINDKAVTISQAENTIASINFNLENSVPVIFNANFTVKSTADAVLTLNYYLNNVKVGQTPQTSLTANNPLSVCLYYCFERPRPGRNTLAVMATVSAGTAAIAPEELIATVSGQYMLGETGPKVPEINITQNIPKTALNTINLQTKNLSDNLDDVKILGSNQPVGENMQRHSLTPINLTLRGLYGAVIMNSIVQEAYRISNTQIGILFSNVVSHTGASLLIGGFRVLFEHNDVNIISAVTDHNEVILQTQNLSGFDELVVQYNAPLGNLIGVDGGLIESFNFII